MQYLELSKEDLQKEYEKVKAEYDSFLSKGYNLNLTRGKPESKQLDLSAAMFDLLKDGYSMDGTDTRNYGGIEGLPSARKYFAEILGCKPEQVIVENNASLELMYNLISRAYTHGLLNSPRPWSEEKTVRFLCPSPGYDRHFMVSSSFGMECILVPMTENGPDMDLVEELVKDPLVKGIWTVPKYSNPDGCVYSEETCQRLANLKPAAPDFVIMWDNAYCIHSFTGEPAEIPEMLSLCEKAGSPDMVYEFASTSKITFAGAGICCLACSEENLKYLLSKMKFQTIGPNKIIQMLHVRFLKDKKTTLEHMKKHAAFLAPKFEMVQSILEKEIAPCGFATWTHPTGGYFLSFYTLPGTASRLFNLCKAAGVTLTTAGAAFPGGKDPDDRHIRLAPSFPPIEEVEKAMRVFVVSAKLAALEKLLAA